MSELMMIRKAPETTENIRDLALAIAEARRAYLNAIGMGEADALKAELVNLFLDNKGAFGPMLTELADRRECRIDLPVFAIAKLQVKPGDVVILKSAELLSDTTMNRIRAMFEGLLPHGNKVAVVHELDIAVLTEGDAA